MASPEAPRPPTTASRFFSLKWKALLFTSLVLVAVTVAISLRAYTNLNTQFDRYRQAAHARYVRETQALIEQSLDRLRELGGMFPTLPGMQQSLVSGEAASIRAAFEPQWPVLQFDLGMDVVAFYDSTSRPLADWQAIAGVPTDSRQLLAWVQQVNTTEKPLQAVNCDRDCLQYAVVPMLADSHSVGALLVGTSLADVVRSFSQITGHQIGLIVSDGGQTDMAGDTVRWLPGWRSRVVALTNDKQSLPVLQQVAAEPLSAALHGTRRVVMGRSYELKLIPLPRLQGDKAAYLAVIADITIALEEIRDATREILIGGGAGWLLSELLLLLILWMPMSRLRVTAGNLPRLAQRQFEGVRSAMRGQSRRHWLDDETDVLNSTTFALADRLEELEDQVAHRSRALQQRMEELQRERDFIASLLDNAQVVILTQDRRGCIVQVNDFTQELTGYQEQDLIGQPFITRLIREGPHDLGVRLQEELASGHRPHLQHESMVICKNNSLRNITWHHSRLVAVAPEDPVILSVGLDITERLGAESRLAWLSDHDALTGLLNRRRFEEELEVAVTTAKRHHRTGAVLFVDLDQFKYVNDTSGHVAGDSLLKAVGTTLSGSALAADLVARLGGDEFAIMVRDTDSDEAVQLADQLQNALSELNFKASDQTFRMSASIGIVLFPQHADTVDDLMASADLALDQAKQEGSGRWHLFSENDETRERIHNRMYWRDKVSEALAEDRFMLYYQPILEIKSGRISHYEVLLRMRGENGMIIAPAQFISAAERSGMIHAVDRLVVSKAIRFLAELCRNGTEVSFAINLSGYAFNDPQLLPHLRQELTASGVEASRVIFEITETAAVSDFAVANSLMLAIKELGCRFALDDFGIGFSSFYYLKYLPVDYLKIDGSFIHQLDDNLDDQIIVQAMRQVAGQFGKKTVAEFVETPAVLELLRDYQIDYAQGYLISKPLCAEDTFR